MAKIKINAENKEVALKNLKKGFFQGTDRKVISGKLIAKAKTKKNPSIYKQYEFVYKEK